MSDSLMNGESPSPTPTPEDESLVADGHNDGARADDDEKYEPSSEEAEEAEDEEEDGEDGQAAADTQVAAVEEDDEDEQLVRRVGKRRRGAVRRFSSKPRAPVTAAVRKRRKKVVSSSSEDEQHAEAPAPQEQEENDDEESEAEGAENDNGEEEEEAEPVQPVTDSREITLTMDQLNRHLACRLCGGYYREATTIIECAHTFCRLCLQRHIEHTNEHRDALCPYSKCPARLKTADPLRNETKFDRALQNLVDKLLPQFAQADEQLRREMQSSAGPRPGQAQAHAARRRRAEPSMGAALLFELTPHPSSSLPPLAKPLIKTQATATVRNIRQLLLHQLRLKVDEGELLVYCSDELLAADHSLDFIRRTRWHEPDKHMQIQYKVV